MRKIKSENETVDNPIKYIGEYYDDELDMIYSRARYYVPSIEEDSVIFRDVDTDGKLEDEIHSIPYKEITQISFGDNYSKMYWKYVNVNPDGTIR